MTKVIIDCTEVDVPPEYTLATGVRAGRRGDSALLLPQGVLVFNVLIWFNTIGWTILGLEWLYRWFTS